MWSQANWLRNSRRCLAMPSLKGLHPWSVQVWHSNIFSIKHPTAGSTGGTHGLWSDPAEVREEHFSRSSQYLCDGNLHRDVHSLCYRNAFPCLSKHVLLSSAFLSEFLRLLLHRRAPTDFPKVNQSEYPKNLFRICTQIRSNNRATVFVTGRMWIPK